MISHAELHDGETVHRIAMLSPLAVAPRLHKQGIGSGLVREACARADVLGDPVVVLEGSPAYYPRFGFVDSRTLGIEIHLPDWAPPEAGQALRLSAYDASLRGTVVYPPPFRELE
jgi:putative acetyltransferase